MKTGFGTGMIAAAVLLFHGAAQTAEIKIIASNGVTEIMNVLGPQYERTTGNKLVIHLQNLLLERQRRNQAL